MRRPDYRDLTPEQEAAAERIAEDRAEMYYGSRVEADMADRAADRYEAGFWGRG